MSDGAGKTRTSERPFLPKLSPPSDPPCEKSDRHRYQAAMTIRDRSRRMRREKLLLLPNAVERPVREREEEERWDEWWWRREC